MVDTEVIGSQFDNQITEDGEDEVVKYRYVVNIDPQKYAKRFGIDIPDDSADTGLTDEDGNDDSLSDEQKQPLDGSDSGEDNEQPKGEERAQDGANGLFEVDAEDATVDYGKRMSGTMAGQCAATLAQCKAKNPMTCRFHGAKVIAQDIERFLRNRGVGGQVDVSLLNVSKQGGKELLSAEVVVTGTKKEEKLVTSAMKAFANLPGVNSVEDGYYEQKRIYTGFDIDILDPNAQAKWGAGQTSQQVTQPPQPQTQKQPPNNPAPKPKAKQKPVVAKQQAQTPTPAPSAPATPTAPQPTGIVQPPPSNRLHPPTAPHDPGKWTGMDEKDMEFLEEVGTNLAYLAQRVNHNIAKGDPSKYGAGQTALPKFQAIDVNRLKALAAKDSQAAVIAKMYDDAKASEAAGWSVQILGDGQKYDESQYNSSDPTASTQYYKWGFDRSKVAGYKAWQDAKDIFEKWEDPSKQRKSLILGCNHILTSSDPKAPKSSVSALSEANDAMTDIEQQIGDIEAEIKGTQDNTIKAALTAALEELEGVYFDVNKAWDDAKKEIATWDATQRTMTASFGYKEAENYYKSRGLSVPIGVQNWENWVKQNEKQADAIVARKYGNRPGWGTAKERQERVEQLRKNWQHLWPHIHIYHNATHYIETSLQNNGGIRANRGDSDYKYALHNAFGVPTSTRVSDTDMQLYTILSIDDTPMKSSWCSGSKYVVELDPKHTIGGVVYDNGCGYWNSSVVLGNAMNLISRCGLTDIAYKNGRNHFNPESAEKDFSKMTPKQMFNTMFPHGEHSLEFHPVNGASIDQQNIKAIWTYSKLSSATSAILKKAGIPNFSTQTGKPH